jgi:hypothetical protein
MAATVFTEGDPIGAILRLRKEQLFLPSSWVTVAPQQT